MKRKLIYIYLGIICFVGLMTLPKEIPPPAELRGRGYSVSFDAFTYHSTWPSNSVVYCLTEDGYLVFTRSTPVTMARMREISFDEQAFLALCTDCGYWQGKYSPEYICDNIQCCWKGQVTARDIGPLRNVLRRYIYLLQLRDGTLMVAESTFFRSDREYIEEVNVIESAGTQQEFLADWHKYMETMEEQGRTDPYWEIVTKRLT